MCDFSQYGGPSEEWLEVQKTMPSLTFDLDMEQQKLKDVVNGTREELSAKAMETLRPNIQMTDYSIPTRDHSTIEARSYRPASKDASEKLPVYLYFHGGGFFFGTLASEDATCASIAIAAGVVVLNINYRHTPEHAFPVAWNDSQDSFEWLHEHIDKLGVDANKVVVGGVSAGAELTASLILEKHLGKSLTQYPPIAGQLLLIPAVAHKDTYADAQLKKLKSLEVFSFNENIDAPILPQRTIDFFMDLLKTGTPSLKDTKLNAGNADPDDVKGMCPTVFGIAGLDPLRDEGLLYAKTLSEAGVPTDTYLFKGVPHGFRRFSQLSASKKWDDVVVNGIKWCLESPKATGKFEVKVL